METGAPLLYSRSEQPARGPPSTSPSDIQNEVRRQLAALLAERDEEGRRLRSQVEALAYENSELRNRVYDDVHRQPVDTGVGTANPTFPRFGWLSRGIGSLIGSGPSMRALDFRPGSAPGTGLDLAPPASSVMDFGSQKSSFLTTIPAGASGPRRRSGAIAGASGSRRRSGAIAGASGPRRRSGAIAGASGSRRRSGAIAGASGPRRRSGAIASASGPRHRSGALAGASGPRRRSSAIASASGPRRRSSAIAGASGPRCRSGAIAGASGPRRRSGLRRQVRSHRQVRSKVHMSRIYLRSETRLSQALT